MRPARASLESEAGLVRYRKCQKEQKKRSRGYLPGAGAAGVSTEPISTSSKMVSTVFWAKEYLVFKAISLEEQSLTRNLGHGRFHDRIGVLNHLVHETIVFGQVLWELRVAHPVIRGHGGELLASRDRKGKQLDAWLSTLVFLNIQAFPHKMGKPQQQVDAREGQDFVLSNRERKTREKKKRDTHDGIFVSN